MNSISIKPLHSNIITITQMNRGDIKSFINHVMTRSHNRFAFSIDNIDGSILFREMIHILKSNPYMGGFKRLNQGYRIWIMSGFYPILHMRLDRDKRYTIELDSIISE